MSTLVELMIVAVAITLLCSNLSLRADLKLTKELLELSRSANKQLEEKLRTANLQIEELTYGKETAAQKKTKIPAFLLADDPMEGALKDVGRLRK